MDNGRCLSLPHREAGCFLLSQRDFRIVGNVPQCFNIANSSFFNTGRSSTVFKFGESAFSVSVCVSHTHTHIHNPLTYPLTHTLTHPPHPHSHTHHKLTHTSIPHSLIHPSHTHSHIHHTLLTYPSQPHSHTHLCHISHSTSPGHLPSSSSLHEESSKLRSHLCQFLDLSSQKPETIGRSPPPTWALR